MGEGTTELNIKGRAFQVPAVSIQDVTIAVMGRILKTAVIKGEAWLEKKSINDPTRLIKALEASGLKVDIFHFNQMLPDLEPKYHYPIGWQNVAAIPLTSYSDWWENRASQVTRKNVRRSAKRGVAIRRVEFNDSLIEAIVRINNEVPVRTGRKFWHYGKSFETVKKDYSAYLERSEFLGAFYQNEIIGFSRLILQGEIASVMQLLSFNAHYDKRPSNALIAAAVESCVSKGIRYLIYGQYTYDDNADNPLTEFKRRNGFEPYLVPGYYVPFTFKGRLAIKLNLHAGLKKLMPKPLMNLARILRARHYERKKTPLAKEDD